MKKLISILIMAALGVAVSAQERVNGMTVEEYVNARMQGSAPAKVELPKNYHYMTMRYVSGIDNDNCDNLIVSTDSVYIDFISFDGDKVFAKITSIRSTKEICRNDDRIWKIWRSHVSKNWYVDAEMWSRNPSWLNGWDIAKMIGERSEEWWKGKETKVINGEYMDIILEETSKNLIEKTFKCANKAHNEYLKRQALKYEYTKEFENAQALQSVNKY